MIGEKEIYANMILEAILPILRKRVGETNEYKLFWQYCLTNNSEKNNACLWPFFLD